MAEKTIGEQALAAAFTGTELFEIEQLGVSKKATVTQVLALGGGGGAHAVTHVATGTDPLTLTQAQITGLVAALAAINSKLASAIGLVKYSNAATVTRPTTGFAGYLFHGPLTAGGLPPPAMQATDIHILGGSSTNEAIGVTDSIVVAVTYGSITHARTVTDSVGVTDSSATTSTYNRTVTDPVGVTDPTTVTTAGGTAYTATVTDSVGVGDPTTKTSAYTYTVTDPVGVPDPIVVTSTGAHSQTVTDSVGVADPITVTSAGNSSVTVINAVGVTDLAIATSNYNRTVTDPVGVDDLTTVTTGGGTAHSRIVTDGVGVGDSIVIASATFRVTEAGELRITEAGEQRIIETGGVWPGYGDAYGGA